ncbi:gluconolactonase [Cnuella takakiae]|uniref:Gluconolactonase n=1 Tax=Cnuella takakiae TaxID=1302690 RepID=A0A1M4WWM1_9BACT|nr:SMP-30/gluconolactonase/LRE family protein [Cnuella takakiae]SHE85644.1 gluconolactonase [Cnuella takakiae]
MNKLFAAFILLVSVCAHAQHPTIGYIERLHPSLDKVLNPAGAIEILDSGYTWVEGPLWLPSQRALLFSDIPSNRVLQWTEAGGSKTYVQPSGYTGSVPRSGEVGSNGLLLLANGQLLLCQHGDRRLAVMDAPLSAPTARFHTLAAAYQGKRFNSPNDAVQTRSGIILFTDPPYGLEGNDKDTAKELPFQGVYQLEQNGKVRLLTDTISRPNGIGLSPDGKTLVVANSDAGKAGWYGYQYDEKNGLQKGRMLLDVTPEVRAMGGGLPDGLKFNRLGYLFATGPGGVWVFDPKLQLVGRIRLPVLAANLALDETEKTLYITATQYVLRLVLR